MNQIGQSSRTRRNVQEQIQSSDRLQNALSDITNSRNEIFTSHRQGQSPSLVYHDTEQLFRACDHANESQESVEINLSSTSQAPISATIINSSGFQTMNSIGVSVSTREQQSTQVHTEIMNVDPNTDFFINPAQSHLSQLPEQLYQQQVQYLETEVQRLRHQITQELAHLPLFIMQHQHGCTFTFYLSLEGTTNIMNNERAITGASATPTDNINLFINHQTPSHPFQLPEPIYFQQIQCLERDLQRLRHQNAQELAYFLLLSLQRQQEDRSTSLLSQEDSTNIVDDESAIPGASVIPTGSDGENNSTTNFDDQAENLPTILQPNEDSPSGDENAGPSSQDGHRDTGNRSRCRYCPPSHPGFSRNRDIPRHIASVHNGERHTCDTCGKRFSRIDGLLRHLRTHN